MGQDHIVTATGLRLDAGLRCTGATMSSNTTSTYPNRVGRLLVLLLVRVRAIYWGHRHRKFRVEMRTDGTALIYNRDGSGQRTGPGGTPLTTTNHQEKDPEHLCRKSGTQRSSGL